MRFQKGFLGGGFGGLVFLCFAIQTHTFCLLSCHSLFSYMTINSSQKQARSGFTFYLDMAFHHQAQGAQRLVWSFFCSYFMNKVSKEGTKQPCQTPPVSEYPSRLLSLRGLLLAATLTVLFCFDPIWALNSFLDDHWFCYKRWLMNNNVFRAR